uniref:UPF0481 protein At3g47200-like n=1 Tax=Fragaria vesca subsp. vesca TaxID=101020 RepID=UPI0005C94E88|nr:PREDICTED: UPF0481 protein At3g47200-like [Fragaria vesca subsp. vesca]
MSDNNGSTSTPRDDTEKASTPLEILIGERLEQLAPLSASCSIYRVPERLRSLNPSVYTPKLVSIGPLHHGNETLQDMEEHKYRYLQQFLDRTNENLEYYLRKIRYQEATLRSYYAETIKFSSDDLVTIILVDSAFIIELFLNYYFKEAYSTDRIMRAPYMIIDVRADLLLLENQLPFFILEDIFPEKVHRNSRTQNSQSERLSFIQLCRTFFKQELEAVGVDCNLERVNSSEVKGAHFLDIIRNLCLPPEPLVRGTRNAATPIAPSITQLHQAGVKLEVGSTRNLFGTRFDNGILQIPKLQMSHRMVDTMRNIAVFEQCHHLNCRIADFLDLMYCFVDTAKDVELLAEYGIVKNLIGDNSEACSLIKNLIKEIHVNSNDFCFTPLYEDLHKHCKKPWNKWKANLKQNYLYTPWALVSVLIILTIIQTVCSVISL